jgi:hypothetical protein
VQALGLDRAGFRVRGQWSDVDESAFALGILRHSHKPPGPANNHRFRRIVATFLDKKTTYEVRGPEGLDRQGGGFRVWGGGRGGGGAGGGGGGGASTHPGGQTSTTVTTSPPSPSALLLHI